ncbi:MAG TPA: bifunctional precorrin-2 dehydrogenase/sirohydrochlorin ferrochelatase [Acidimicrobiales bacterium]|jgi:precorrin-2 dehydrogenase/sirohydrochlorin ferrochelatase|nr:bifunctional precorrin-2 dehydrogenase/sirohydrochlorin ferrochelatase [Acidimicrobiales bacterium]
MQYPVNLVLDGRPCLVVGGGHIALRKVEGLLACGGWVTVVAPRIVGELRGLAGVTCEERGWRPADMEGMWLVIAATDDPGVNRAVYEAGEAAGIWVNGADDPANCSFTLPSVVRRGDLQVTVSTGGRSPALATWLRRRLEGEIGPEYAALLELLAAEREGLKAAGRSTEGLDWQSALDSDMLGLIRDGELVRARERLLTCLSSSSD